MTGRNVIVVGAGSAGAVLAAGLSADPDVRVLLLEAGADHPSAGTSAGIRSRNFFEAVGEPGRIWPDLLARRAAGQAESVYLRGRGVGGSSAVNGMCALRGTPDDYDRWVREYVCAGWGWTEFAGAFLQIEDDADLGGDGIHGRGGPLPLWRLPHDQRSPFEVALHGAMRDLGFPDADDYHAPGASGISRAALTMRDGRRVSTNDAYLEPARDRPNLAVRGDVLVDRVLLEGRRAVGVRLANGTELEADEVILAAGAIHSPAILLRSSVGVGDGLPVGRNLCEHASTPGFEIGLRPDARLARADVPLLRGMLRFSSGLADAGPNDLQVLWFPVTGTDAGGLPTARLIGSVMRVFSRGEVWLRSPDPTVDPAIDFRLLSDRRDLVRLRACVRTMLEIVAHPSVRAVTEDVVALTTPVEELDSDDAIDAWLLANVTDYVHAAGTCRMGAAGDPSAVVDTECRVQRYERLRVCDASVMPDVPRANTHLTTVAIAHLLVGRMRAGEPPAG